MPGSAGVLVAWQAASGSPTGYTATANPGGLSCSTTTALSCTVTGLTSGASYTFSVIARDGTTLSAPATTTSVTAGADAEAPYMLSYDVTPRAVDVSTSDQQVTVTTRLVDATGARPPMVQVFDQHDNEVIYPTQEMTLVAGDARDGTWSGRFTVPTGATPGRWSVQTTNLTDGTHARIAGPDVTRFSDALQVANGSTVPGAPIDVAGTPGDGTVALTWNPPADNGGNPVRGFTVSSSPAGAACTTTAPYCLLTGLTNGTSYTFTVQARNDNGYGPASVPSAPVAPGPVPTAPTNVRAAARNASAVVTWTPSDPRCHAITGYTVYPHPFAGEHSNCSTTGSTSCTVPGLTNRTAYTFTVYATNAVGSSTDSDPSNSVTPRGGHARSRR